MRRYDIIIVGGGISGTMAGIAASRIGAQVLVIESYGFLGGMLTTAGVGPMMTFHAGEKQVIQGITSELINRLVAKGQSIGHIFDTVGYTYSLTPFDIEGMKQELEMMLLESGGQVLYHTMLAKVHREGAKIEKITICNKAGLSDLEAKIYIDATGDADLAVWAGVPYTKGREKDGAAQPMTMKMRMGNVDMAQLKNFIHEHPEEFPLYQGDTSIIEKSPRLSTAGFVKKFQKAKERGEISIPREDVLLFESNTPGEVILNTTRILGCDSTDPWSLSKAEIEGRKQCRELELFLKKYIPGFKNANALYSGPSIGVRGSRQIQGIYTLTAKDILTMQTFDDVIAHSGYPIDIHSPDGGHTDHAKLEWGGMYSIPYRTLITHELDNLIVVGRCISATFEAQAAIRTTPTVGAIGQAGGIAASLAAKKDTRVQQIDTTELQNILLQQKAYLEI
ncbi:MAG: FAD-dependent oxidoreductase [Epulopiscium sp.]|nr:FAD-dependent oxidoreductase [Candidatus Epulonipiscium sp.]